MLSFLPSSCPRCTVPHCLHTAPGRWFAALLAAVLLLGGGASCAAAQSAAGGQRGGASAALALQRAFETADSLRRARRFRDQLALLSDLRQRHPAHVSVLYRLAFTWSDLGKAAATERQTVEFYRKALAVARKALAADSTSAWAHFAAAVAQGRLALHVGTRERVERSRAVKAHAERAIALDPTLAGAYHVRGRWHREAADLNVVQRALVAAIYGGLPAASLDQAVADFKTAIALEQRAYHHLELGKTYLATGRPEAAREQFRKALGAPRADPFDPVYKQEARQLLDAP